MGVEYPPAIDYFNDDPNWIFPQALQGLSGNQLTIVNHQTACSGFCSAMDVAAYFHNIQSNPGKKTAHFIVGRDGSVVQVVRIENGAGGNCCVEQGYDTYWQLFLNTYGNLNLCTISIEHENWDSNNLQANTEAQIQASIALQIWLCQRLGISYTHIKTHRSIDPISRANCPGPNFPMARIITAVKESQNVVDTTDQFFRNNWLASGQRIDTGIYQALLHYRHVLNLCYPNSAEITTVGFSGSSGIAQRFGSYFAWYHDGQCDIYDQFNHEIAANIISL